MIARHAPYGGLLHEVVEHNGVLHLGGVVSEDLTLDMAGQVADVLRQVDDLLTRYGSGRDRVLSALIFVPDLALKDDLNRAWTTFFEARHLPTRATVGVADLGPNVLIEMVLTAAVTA